MEHPPPDPVPKSTHHHPPSISKGIPEREMGKQNQEADEENNYLIHQGQIKGRLLKSVAASGEK